MSGGTLCGVARRLFAAASRAFRSRRPVSLVTLSLVGLAAFPASDVTVMAFPLSLLRHRSLCRIRSRYRGVFTCHRVVSDGNHNGNYNGNHNGQTSTPRTSADDHQHQRREDKYNQLMTSSRLSLAPMMEYTDRHFRHLVRLISSNTLLYTEMVAANALAHERLSAQGDYRQSHPEACEQDVIRNFDDGFLRRYLGQGAVPPFEGPSVLQLGGSDPQQMFEAAQTLQEMTRRGWCDYTAINLNCGCPSPKVAGKGCFGAALMDDPKLVADLTSALHDGINGELPITVKCRIGTDSRQPFSQQTYAELDPEEEYANLCRFIETVASNDIVTDFAVHARIAVLQKSFSPSDNRKIPPLRYDVVRRLVSEYPELTFTLNGGVDSLAGAKEELDACPGLLGVMVGRAWAANPWGFAMVDQLLYNQGSSSSMNRWEILQEYGKHADAEEDLWDPVKIRRFIVKAVSPLFAGEPNAKRFRIALDEIAGTPKKLASQGKPLSGFPPLSELLLNAAKTHLSEAVLFRTPEESYERMRWKEAKSSGRVSYSRVVSEWQTERKQLERKDDIDDIAKIAASSSNSSDLQSVAAL